MNYRTKAVYRNGAFIPESPCDLPEEAKVDLLVQGPLLLPAEVTDSEERSRVLKQVTQRMQQNPIIAGAPRYTRDELPERSRRL